MKPILLIDTASPCCSVALVDQQVLAQRQTDEQRQSAQKVLPLVAEVLVETGLKQAELGCIGVINGPGSFTGMRIGVSIAQGLGFANRIPVATVSSLAALAYSAFEGGDIANWLVTLQAREDEVYVGGFACQAQVGVELLIPEQVIAAADETSLDDQLKLHEPWGLAGDVEVMACRELFASEFQPATRSSEDRISLTAFALLVRQQLASGQGLEPAAALPNYVKDQMRYG